MATVEPTSYSPLNIPSKWDIIPIHNSDRAAFKRCRRYWDWSSPARQNLTIRADVHGINTNLWFGTGIHWALEQYYTPGLRRDPVEAWKTWFDIQWRGGVVTEEWLDRVYDLKPVVIRATDALKEAGYKPSNLVGILLPQPTYRVRGLEDILPDADHNVYDDLLELGIQMMGFYKQYASVNDGFEVIVTEHTFSVPIWDYANDRILTAVDKRENSPNYGVELEVHARGRMDAMYRRPNGKIGIVDHKTAEKIGEDYFRKLETDEQITSYLWSAEVEAKYYDLPYKNESIEEVIYNVLRKTYPKPPTVLKNGMFSVARDSESTTYEMLQAFINKELPGVALSEKQQEYVNYLRDVGDEQFIMRKQVRRNRAQIANAGQRIYLEALDMLAGSELRIYPNITNDFMCLNCQFRGPCMAREDGSDYKSMLKDNYTINKDR